MLNWNLPVITDFITGFIFLIASFLNFFTAKTKEVKPLYYLGLGWFFMGCVVLSEGFSYLFLNIPLARLSCILTFPTTLFSVIGIDQIIKEKVDGIKLIPVFMIGGLLLYTIFEENIFVILVEKGSTTVFNSSISLIFVLLMLSFTIVLYLFWTMKTFLKSPKILKKTSFLFFLGGLMMGPIWLILSLFNSNIMQMIAYLCLAIGALLTVATITKEPKLLYILPFTVYRMIIYDENGLLLYSYQWIKSNFDLNLITGFLTALQSFSDEALKKGKISEIILEEGVLILEQSHSIIIGLLTSKTSKLLRTSLDKFFMEFQAKYKNIIEDESRDLLEFESAIELIKKYFSYLPFNDSKN
ncbi:MAG: conserved membrane protein of unknown function [Promethearchaeota archaeon]|nr:MAG: conserved membrane protein of unknown function [Candidatus Lokiarchaeota archaeon]